MTTEEKIAALTAFMETVRGLEREAVMAGRWAEARMHDADLYSLNQRRAELERRLAAQPEPPTN